MVIYTLLSYPILDESIAGIREGLAARGFGPDKVTVREVNANGQTALLNSFAKQILDGKPDVVVPVSTPVAQAVVSAAPPAQQIVFSTVTNPADAGVGRKLPNLTGVSDVVNYEANIDLIRELFPSARRIALIYNPAEQNSQYALRELRPLLAARKLDLVPIPVSNSAEAVSATRALPGRADVLYLGSDNTAASAIDGIITAARRGKVPVIASDAGSVEKGALAAVSVDYRRLGRAAGGLIADVLATGKPAGQFPNVLFKGDRLILNEDAAQATGVTFSPSLRARSVQVLPLRNAAA